jgi:hypothetical protein
MSDSPQTNAPNSAGVAQAREPNHLLAAVGLGILINALIPPSGVALRIIYVIVAVATAVMVRRAGIGVPEKQTWFANTSRIIMTRLTKNPDQWWTVFSMFGAIVASLVPGIIASVTALALLFSFWITSREKKPVQAVQEGADDSAAAATMHSEIPSAKIDKPPGIGKAPDEIDSKNAEGSGYEKEQRERWEGWIKDEIDRLDDE